MDRRMMTPEELAEFLGVPIATLYQWKLRGVGPVARKIGRHLRYLPHEVDAWVDEQASTPKDAA